MLYDDEFRMFMRTGRLQPCRESFLSETTRLAQMQRYRALYIKLASANDALMYGAGDVEAQNAGPVLTINEEAHGDAS